MTADMNPIDWAKRPLEKYADFNGRAPRAEYWWFVLAILIVGIVVSIIESLLGIGKMIGPYGPLTGILVVGTLVPSISVGVRRLHDTNRSGWWMLLMVPYMVAAILTARSMASGNMEGLGSAGLTSLVGLACCIVLIVFFVLAGTPGDNRYGPNPYGGA